MLLLSVAGVSSDVLLAALLQGAGAAAAAGEAATAAATEAMTAATAATEVRVWRGGVRAMGGGVETGERCGELMQSDRNLTSLQKVIG